MKYFALFLLALCLVGVQVQVEAAAPCRMNCTKCGNTRCRSTQRCVNGRCVSGGSRPSCETKKYWADPSAITRTETKKVDCLRCIDTDEYSLSLTTKKETSVVSSLGISLDDLLGLTGFTTSFTVTQTTTRSVRETHTCQRKLYDLVRGYKYKCMVVNYKEVVEKGVVVYQRLVGRRGQRECKKTRSLVTVTSYHDDIPSCLPARKTQCISTDFTDFTPISI